MNGKYGFGGYLRSLFFCQLATPRHALAGGGTFALVVVLHIAGCLDGFRAPLVPSLGAYLARQIAIHKQRIAVVTPGTAEINLVDIGGTGDGALVEDIAVSHLLGRRGRRDVAVGLAVDGALLEPSRRGTEDEVGGALDITVFKVQARARHARIDGILMAQEATVDKHVMSLASTRTV